MNIESPKATVTKLTAMERWKSRNQGIQCRKQIPVSRFDSYAKAYLDDTSIVGDEDIDTIKLK